MSSAAPDPARSEEAGSASILPADGRGPVVGIVGGGQLGRMLALAGMPLGLRFRFLEPKTDAPVAGLGEVIHAPYDDPEGLDALARGAAVVTYEFENVPVEAAARLQERVPVHPRPEALAMAQDRLTEKEGFRALDVPTVPFRPVDSRDGLDAAVGELGLPAVLKTRRMGYDGKGQIVLRAPDDLDGAWRRLGDRSLILEGFSPFDRELSILSVRGTDGDCSFYPLVENEHSEGILVRSRVPARGVDPRTQSEAEAIARRVLEHLDYVGVLAIELFQVDGRLLANEMAPRVHNSGHWTQDGAWTSQFENHLRAILGLPLGDPGIRGGGAVMLNVLGSPPAREALAAVPGVRIHLYDKAPRPGRKIGHVNLVAGNDVGWEEGLAGAEARVRELMS
jgi:5-(carboxyamino)imidazole ribonucleotide synthase